MQTKLYQRVVAHGGALFLRLLFSTEQGAKPFFRRNLGLVAGLTFLLSTVTGPLFAISSAQQEKEMMAFLNWHLYSDKATTKDMVRWLKSLPGDVNYTLISEVAYRAGKNRDLTFSLTPADIKQLKAAGASENLIKAMQQPGWAVDFHMAQMADQQAAARFAQTKAGNATGATAGAIRLAANTTEAAPAGGGQSNVELIIDASGSMAAKIQGRSKMEIAKQALTELLLSIPSNTNVAVRAYGHRKKDDCSDLELIANFGESRSAIPAKVNNLKPLGKTPLSGSINASAGDFAGKEGQENTVILITDGEETCNADPCAAAKTAHESGIKVKINVIGFKIEAKERAQLECIANAGGGKYVSANDAAELTAATKEVAAPVISNPEPAPAATANPLGDNILAVPNGGQLLVAPSDEWNSTNDGKEEGTTISWPAGRTIEGVYAFKDDQPATFEKFSTLVTGAGDSNLKEFELLVGDESPTGTFRSIGTFTVQNAKMLKSPYQEFKFEPVTAKYLKIKLLSNYGAYQKVSVAEFKVVGQTNVKGAESTTKAAPEKKTDNNILAASNGGQLLVAPEDAWSQTIDGKEDAVELAAPAGKAPPEAVFAFKDEQPATFDRFATLVAQSMDSNLKEFELLAGDESPTGTFRSVGTFTVQNAKILKSPYQEFKFEPVTAKYLKIKLNSNYGAYQKIHVYEFKLFGQSGSGSSAEGGEKGTSETRSTSTESKSEGIGAKSSGPNILAQSAGGQVLVAPNDEWQKTNDGKEEGTELKPGQEAVYAFKDEKPATFDKFSTLVWETNDRNLKEFELLAGDESPTGTFRSIGTFTVQNAKMLKSPFQEFKFEPVTAKYLKVKLISNYGAWNRLDVAEFKVSSSSAK